MRTKIKCLVSRAAAAIVVGGVSGVNGSVGADVHGSVGGGDCGGFAVDVCGGIDDGDGVVVSVVNDGFWC